LLALGKITPAHARRERAVVEPAQQLVGRQRFQPRHGELDRERQRVQDAGRCSVTTDVLASVSRNAGSKS
jgi:hypothetical protein